MAKFMIVVLAAVVAACAAQINNGIDCRGVNGPVPDITDCSRFYECYENRAFPKMCNAGLEFNPESRQCDWPSLMPNPQCNRVSMESPDVNAPCARTVGSALIQHSVYCNGYMKCTHGVLNNGCSFCGVGLYFDNVTQRCISTYNVDMVRACNAKQMLAHSEITTMRLHASCFPRDSDLYAALLAKIQAQQGLRP